MDASEKLAGMEVSANNDSNWEGRGHQDLTGTLGANSDGLQLSASQEFAFKEQESHGIESLGSVKGSGMDAQDATSQRAIQHPQQSQPAHAVAENSHQMEEKVTNGGPSIPNVSTVDPGSAGNFQEASSRIMDANSDSILENCDQKWDREDQDGQSDGASSFGEFAEVESDRKEESGSGHNEIENGNGDGSGVKNGSLNAGNDGSEQIDQAIGQDAVPRTVHVEQEVSGQAECTGEAVGCSESDDWGDFGDVPGFQSAPAVSPDAGNQPPNPLPNESPSAEKHSVPDAMSSQGASTSSPVTLAESNVVPDGKLDNAENLADNQLDDNEGNESDDDFGDFGDFAVADSEPQVGPQPVSVEMKEATSGSDFGDFTEFSAPSVAEGSSQAVDNGQDARKGVETGIGDLKGPALVSAVSSLLKTLVPNMPHAEHTLKQSGIVSLKALRERQVTPPQDSALSSSLLHVHQAPPGYLKGITTPAFLTSKVTNLEEKLLKSMGLFDVYAQGSFQEDFKASEAEQSSGDIPKSGSISSEKVVLPEGVIFNPLDAGLDLDFLVQASENSIAKSECSFSSTGDASGMLSIGQSQDASTAKPPASPAQHHRVLSNIFDAVADFTPVMPPSPAPPSDSLVEDSSPPSTTELPGPTTSLNLWASSEVETLEEASAKSHTRAIHHSNDWSGSGTTASENPFDSLRNVPRPTMPQGGSQEEVAVGPETAVLGMNEGNNSGQVNVFGDNGISGNESHAVGGSVEDDWGGFESVASPVTVPEPDTAKSGEQVVEVESPVLNTPDHSPEAGDEEKVPEPDDLFTDDWLVSLKGHKGAVNDAPLGVMDDKPEEKDMNVTGADADADDWNEFQKPVVANHEEASADPADPFGFLTGSLGLKQAAPEAPKQQEVSQKPRSMAETASASSDAIPRAGIFQHRPVTALNDMFEGLDVPGQQPDVSVPSSENEWNRFERAPWQHTSPGNVSTESMVIQNPQAAAHSQVPSNVHGFAGIQYQSSGLSVAQASKGDVLGPNNGGDNDDDEWGGFQGESKPVSSQGAFDWLAG